MHPHPLVRVNEASNGSADEQRERVLQRQKRIQQEVALLEHTSVCTVVPPLQCAEKNCLQMRKVLQVGAIPEPLFFVVMLMTLDPNPNAPFVPHPGNSTWRGVRLSRRRSRANHAPVF